MKSNNSQGRSRSPFYPKQIILGLLISWIYRLYASTFRYHVNFEKPEDKKLFFELLAAKKSEQSPIFAFFHQLELALIPYFINSGVYILVSPSKDGEILNTVLKEYGFNTLRGSSSKKAKQALVNCIKEVRAGHKLALATDGPRGPKFKIKYGVINICEKTNHPILPIWANVSTYKILPKTWDLTLVPFPFSRIDIHIGEIRAYQALELEELLSAHSINK